MEWSGRVMEWSGRVMEWYGNRVIEENDISVMVSGVCVLFSM